MKGAPAILAEGVLRPADWDYDPDPALSGMTAFCLGTAVGRDDTKFPNWAIKSPLDRSQKKQKKGKGLQPAGHVGRGTIQGSIRTCGDEGRWQ